MSAKILKNPAASVRARLLTHARANDDNYDRVLTRYAIERFLFRLSQTDAVERFVLKGAMLFVTWPEHALRPTGDLDLLGRGPSDPEAIVALFTRICEVALPEDGIVFDAATIRAEAIREAEKYRGIRLRLRASLGNTPIALQIDIGFGDHVHPEPRRQAFPGLLPGLPTATLLMYPPETVVAEKFEAMIHFGEINGRAKDFHDIWVTTRTFPFEMADLVEAINGTLARRHTERPTDVPVGLTDIYAASVADRGLWTGFLRRTPPALEPPDFPTLQGELRRFFGPVLAALARPESARGRWDHNAAVWR